MSVQYAFAAGHEVVEQWCAEEARQFNYNDPNGEKAG